MTTTAEAPRTTGDLTVRPRDIVGTAEVRRMCGGITRHTLLKWRADRGFPPPIRKLRQGEVWDARDVRAWIKQYDVD